MPESTKPCDLCRTHYGDSNPCDEGKPVNSPHRLPYTFCEPWCASLNSEPKAVARRLSAMLTALSNVDDRIIKGALPDEAREFRMSVHERLKADGWRITGTQNGWKVLPPLTPRKRAR